MAGLFGEYKTDVKKETEGVEVTFALNADDTVPTFRVARMGPSNTKYQKAVERITRPYRRQIEAKTIKNEVADRLNIEIFVDSILLGWENVQDENGKVIPFSAENARKLFTELPDLFFELQTQAKDIALFRAEVTAVEAKN